MAGGDAHSLVLGGVAGYGEELVVAGFRRLGCTSGGVGLVAAGVGGVLAHGWGLES